MRALLLPCFAILSLAFSGCSAIYSIHPLNTSDDAVEEPALEGTWAPANQADDPPLCIQKMNDQVYGLVISDPDTKAAYLYSVNLVQIDSHLFANLFANGQMFDGKEVDPPFGMVAHNIILKLDVDDSGLNWSVLSPDAIEEQNKSASTPLSSIALSNDETLLTSSSDDLRQYISIYSDQIFGAQHHYIRKLDTTPPGRAQTLCGIPVSEPPGNPNN